MNPDFKFKVIVIGESGIPKSNNTYYGLYNNIIMIGVGKTSIVKGFLNPEIHVTCMTLYIVHACMHAWRSYIIIKINILDNFL